MNRWQKPADVILAQPDRDRVLWMDGAWAMTPAGQASLAKTLDEWCTVSPT